MECGSDLSTANSLLSLSHLSLSSSCGIDYRPDPNYISHLDVSSRYKDSDSAIGESCLASNNTNQHDHSTNLISKNGQEFRDFRSFCNWLVLTKPNWCDWTPVTDIRNNLSEDLLQEGREILWRHSENQQTL